MKIPYGKHTIDDNDLNAVARVLRSDFLTQGPTVKNFEEGFAKEVGAKFAVSFSNATAALHCGFKVLNKNNKLKVITTPITFAASANCVLYEQAPVVFADIDPLSFNISLDQIEDLLKKNPNDYQGIIPVDFAGLPVNMEELRKLADKYGLWIMEDACHAIGGGFYDSKNIFQACGSAHYSDLAVFYFHPVKHIATGEGGIVTTNNENYYHQLLKLRSHGIERNPGLFVHANDGGWYHEMQELGYNYRMSDINAALGLSQLTKLSANIEQRQLLAAKYHEFFKNSPIQFQVFDPLKFKNAYHLFVVQCSKRKELYDYLKAQDIYAQVHYIPVYKHPYYQSHGYASLILPHAEKYYEMALSLPMYHGLTAPEWDYLAEKLHAFIQSHY